MNEAVLPAGAQPRDLGDAARLRRRRLAWLFTEASNEPFAALVQRFVFSAYFANVFVGDPRTGAAVWATGLSAVGILTFVGAPLVGAYADATGRRKSLLAALTVTGALSCLMLWFAVPGAPVLPFLAVFVIASVCVELTIVVTNAALPGLGSRQQIGLLSGICFAVGQFVAILALFGVRYLSGFEGTDAGYRADRAAALIAGAALLLFLLPYLLLAERDAPAVARMPAPRATVRVLIGTLRNGMAHRSMRGLLICRAIGGDGLSLVFAFGAVLAGVALGWGGAELAVFGLFVTATAMVGGLLSGLLDRLFGARPVVLAGFGLVALGTIGIIGAGPDSVFFIPVSRDPQLGRLTAAELGYAVSGMLAAMGAGPSFSGMRALMARIAPLDRSAAYFGAFSLAGRATAFLGPMAYGAMLAATGNQQHALSVVFVFLAIGVWALSSVTEKRMPDVER